MTYTPDQLKLKKEKPKSVAERKKAERDAWREAGGAFKEIKFTKKALEKLEDGKNKNNFKKDWEYIDFLLKNTCD